MKQSLLTRIGDEMAQAWAILLKDIRVYYLQPPMIMWGLIMPFFIFFSFSVRRNLGIQCSMANLLALTTFFTASSSGPVIIPLERRERTYDRLLTAPMSICTVILGKALVGMVFSIAASLLPLLIGIALLGAEISTLPICLIAIVLSTITFSAFGLLFASLPAQSVGTVMMPSTLLRWPLLFISGVFVPLSEMPSWARIVSLFSPLTYGQDLLHHTLDKKGVLNPGLDIGALAASAAIFLAIAYALHVRSRQIGY